jgi:hypothetical protein
VVLAACGRHADPAWVEARLAEAHERNAAALAAHAGDDEREAWTVSIVAPTGSTEVLPFRRFAALPQTEVATRESAESRSDTVVHFRGVRLSELIARAPGVEHATDVTLTASDGFRATIALDDARLFPILLATDADGAPLGRDHGGPVYAVYPITGSPELESRYSSSWWVFYVTHVVVGTPPPAVRVAGHDLDAAALAALPSTPLSAQVGYRVGWPSEPVLVHGVRIRELIAAVGETLAPDDRVRVLSRAPITRGEERPTFLSADDVLAHDAMLALAYGETREPIPSRLGGPVALAFPPEVGAHLTDHDWLTFVDELVIVRGDTAPTAPPEATP